MKPSARLWLAASLWLVLAFCVWNVIFDRVVVLAGRRYSYDAANAAREGHFIRIDDTMRPAIRHGVVVASSSAIPVALFGVGAVLLAGRRQRRNMRSR